MYTRAYEMSFGMDVEDTTELEALREDEADVLVAHADGQMTSEDYAEVIALAVATGWRPRCLRQTTRMTDAEREAPTIRPEAP